MPLLIRRHRRDRAARIEPRCHEERVHRRRGFGQVATRLVGVEGRYIRRKRIRNRSRDGFQRNGEQPANGWIRNASPPWVALPMIYKRTGPGLATDGGLKFDLNQLNDTFFTTLRSRIVACRDRDIYVMVMFFIGIAYFEKVERRFADII